MEHIRQRREDVASKGIESRSVIQVSFSLYARIQTSAGTESGVESPAARLGRTAIGPEDIQSVPKRLILSLTTSGNNVEVAVQEGGNVLRVLSSCVAG